MRACNRATHGPALFSLLSMRRAIDISPAGTWQITTALTTVSLVFNDRHRRRLRLTDDKSQDFLLDLSEPMRLKDGDGLVLEGGGIIAVRAAEEPVIDIKCNNTKEKARIAWHLGNRHTLVQVLTDGNLRIREDHVLEQMVKGLGASTHQLKAPFEPEGGAYENRHTHEHGH